MNFLAGFWLVYSFLLLVWSVRGVSGNFEAAVFFYVIINFILVQIHTMEQGRGNRRK